MTPSHWCLVEDHTLTLSGDVPPYIATLRVSEVVTCFWSYWWSVEECNLTLVVSGVVPSTLVVSVLPSNISDQCSALLH